MLTITEAASTNLVQMLVQQNAPEDFAVRFFYEEHGITLQPDRQRTGDTTFRHGGRTVLLLDAQVSQLLAEDTLDVEEAELTLQMPDESE